MAGPSSSRPSAIRWTLPNIITLARICLTPVIALLPFIQGYWPKVIAFVVFLIVKAMNARKSKEAITKNCPYCLAAIPILATRCSGCCAELNAA